VLCQNREYGFIRQHLLLYINKQMSLRQPRYIKDKFCFIFCIFWRWDLARLVGFIILETPQQGVKTAGSRPPRSRYCFTLCDSLSEETLLVETMRALSQTPATYSIKIPCLSSVASNNYYCTLSAWIVGGSSSTRG